MTVADIIHNLEGLESHKLEQLYQEFLVLRAKKNKTPLLSAVESELLNKINTPFDVKKWERLTYLDWKSEFSALNPKEEIEALKLAEAYESYSVERLKNLAQLATLRQTSIDELIEQLGLNNQVHG